MKVPHPIPYQGSKRNIAKYILPFFAKDVPKLIEPFAGSAAISIAAARAKKADSFHINDINKPLISLIEEIVRNPSGIADGYERIWHAQSGREKTYYNYIRDLFNKNPKPDYLLYLLARCVNASVRYNSNGDFNQSPDNRRRGRNPNEMRKDIFATSALLQNKSFFTSKDYKEILAIAKPADLIYLDPPYQGVCTNRDPRYLGGIDYNELVIELAKLNDKRISYILSYDGRRGDTRYGQSLPDYLELHHIEVEAGRSSQSTLLGNNEMTVESLYISKALTSKIPDLIMNIEKNFIWHKPQLELKF